MVAVPAATPVKMPDVPTVATLVLLLAHVPPTVADESAVEAPTHTVDKPVIAAGAAITVTTTDVPQPPLKTYEIVVVPAVIPVTIPLKEPTVATEVLLLLHVPPVTLWARGDVLPEHIPNVPVITRELVIMRMRWFWLSATRRFPFASNSTSVGKLIFAAVAGPQSPLNPVVPMAA